MKDIYLKNNKQLSLNDNDFIGEGGEGAVYSKNGVIYKISHKDKPVIDEKKIKELGVITLPNIITPQEHIFSKSGDPIGYAMKQVSNTIPLARIFTTGYRRRNNVTPEMSVTLVEEIMKGIQHIHDKKILIVDGNEFNYLIDGKDFTTPYFIDVDSYQTPSFPATAIMPSIRDYHAKAFDKNTDWYSFAIIAAQIFVGIHPFKGTHASFKKNEMQKRMESNISIFNKDVSVPSATRSFDLIPSDLRNWMVNVFEDGKRLPPPAIAGKIIAKPQVTFVYGGNKFTIVALKSFEGDVIGVDKQFGNSVIYTTEKIYLNGREYTTPEKGSGLVFHDGNPILASIKDGKLALSDFVSGKNLVQNPIKANGKMIVDNRLYVINNDKFIEIKMHTMGKNIIATAQNPMPILANSTKAYRGVLYSNILGNSHLVIPYNSSRCVTVKVPELDGYKIIDMKLTKQVCVVMAYKNGVYDRLVMKFDTSHRKYDIEIEKNVNIFNSNFIVLDNGLCVLLTGDDTVEIFSAHGGPKKVITNAGIDGAAQLYNVGDSVHYYSGNKIYSMKVK